MWVDPDELNYAKDRNAYEYQADGADWQTATEEDDFLELPRSDSARELVHPATWVAYKQASVAATATGTISNATAKGRIDFVALLNMAQQQQLQQQRRPPSRRGRRPSWSPRPQKKSLSFWLLDLAIESVQKGKDQAFKSASNRHSAVTNMSRWQQQQQVQQQAQVRMGFP